MQALAPYWYVFLIGFLASIGLLIHNQVSRFRRLNKKIQSGDLTNSFSTMTEGLTSLAFIVVLGVGMAILLILSIVAQFI